MTIRSVATLFAALTVLVIIVQSWRVAASINPDEHERLTGAIHTGTRLDSDLERLILETRLGIPGRPDQLTDTLREIQESAHILSPDLIPSTKLRRDLNDNLERCLAQLHEKSGRASEFMMANRALANERRYFPQAVELFLARSNEVTAVERARAANIVRDVMRLDFDQENPHYLKLRDRLTQLPPTEGSLRPIVKHARAIAVAAKATDDAIESILEIPLAESLTQLDVVVQSSFRRSASRAFAQRFALTLMATLLFGYGFLSVVNLRHATRDLMHSNEDLELERLDRERLVEELRDRVRRLEDFDHSPAGSELARISQRSAEDLGESVRTLYASCRTLIEEGGEDLSADSTRVLVEMAESAARVRDGVRLVRELARVTSEATALTEVSLEGALTAAEESFRSRLELAGIEIVRASAPPSVLGDLLLVREILRGALGVCVEVAGPRDLEDSRHRPLSIEVSREPDYVVLTMTLPDPGLPEHLDPGLIREAAETLGGALGVVTIDGNRALKLLLPPAGMRLVSAR